MASNTMKKRNYLCRIKKTVPLFACALLSWTSYSNAQSENSWNKEINIHGFTDIYYAYNANQPFDGSNFIAGTGTSAKRNNEFSLNLAALDIAMSPHPVGFHLILNYGTATEVLHSSERGGTAIGHEVWKPVQQASISYNVPVGRGLLIEAGIFPSHIGFEVFPSKDNWNYSRGWLAEFSPYYQAGIKGSYSFSNELSAQVHLLNGWQNIGETNKQKAIGTQLAWTHPRASVILNTIASPEKIGDTNLYRLFADLIVTAKLSSWLSIATISDIGRQNKPLNDSATWIGYGSFVRISPHPNWSIAVRAEKFYDPEAGMTGTQQNLSEVTTTVTWTPQEHFLLKFETRYDHSTANVFSGNQVDSEDNVLLLKNQSLGIIGAVVNF